MKVIIPVIDNKDFKSQLAGGFHNADFACVYDSDTNKYEWLSTGTIAKKPGNLSIELKRKGINTVISETMPIMALSLFKEIGLNVLKAKAADVESNVKLFLDEKLETLTYLNLEESVSSSCHGSCGSCGTSCN